MMAAGIVHWAPPQAALEAVAAATSDPALSQYGPDAGLPQLRQALRDKLAAENGLTEVTDVPCMLTFGLQGCSTKLLFGQRAPSRSDLGTQICLFTHLHREPSVHAFAPLLPAAFEVELGLSLTATRR